MQVRVGNAVAAFFASLLVGAVGVWAQVAPATSGVTPVTFTGSSAQHRDVNAALSVTSSSLQELTFGSRSETTLSTVVIVDGNEWTLELQRNSVRSKDFEVLVQSDDSGVLHPVEAPPVRTYKGTVRENPEAHVRGSFYNGQLEAVIYTPQAVYGIQPVSRLGIPAAASTHAVYRGADWVDTVGFGCGTMDGGQLVVEPMQPLAPVPGVGQAVAGTGLKVTDLGIDSDFEFYVLNESNIENVVADVELVINGVAPLYEVPTIGITYEITTVIVRTVSGAPYTSTNPNTLLETQFLPHWNLSPQSFIQRDTAHLFTGKEIDSNVIGIAYLGVICIQNNAYGLSQSRFTSNLAARYALTAHEIGHNWNAPHCDGCASCTNCCRIMCSGLGGCSGIITSFGCTEESAITSFMASRSCLSNLSDPQPVPFFDDFPTTTLNTAKWSYNRGGVIGTGASNEPSAANAMELDAAGGELYRDDDLRTNYILLGGAASGQLSFYSQHRTVESGEQLVIDYWRNTGHWTELARITSTGTTQNDFSFNNYLLPANALHNEFRVRFRVEVGETNDDWYIDDVRVSTGCTVDADCIDSLHCNGVESCVSNGCVAGTNPCPGQLCNEATDQCVECLVNADCFDGVFCNGSEACDGSGNCQDGPDPCTTALPYCLEASDTCVECVSGGDCDDGLYCNGAETCVGNACVDSTNPCAPNDCYEANDQCLPPGDMYMSFQSTNVLASSTVPMDVYIVSTNDVKTYQAAINIVRTSGTGTVSVVCPGSVVINDTRPDFVFFGLSDLPNANCTLRRAQSSLLSGSVLVDTDPAYLASFTLTVSADAELGSTFDISFQGSNVTYVKNVDGLFHTVDLGGPYTLTVVDQICDPPTVAAGGSRALLVEPAGNLPTQALRVTSPDWTCLDQYVQADGSLGAGAVFQSAASWGEVIVQSSAIASSSDYAVVADCGALQSSAVMATTFASGDTNNSGIVDLDDLVCILDQFGTSSGVCTMAQADLAPCSGPNDLVDIDDLVALLDAFAGNPDPCPPPCP